MTDNEIEIEISRIHNPTRLNAWLWKYAYKPYIEDFGLWLPNEPEFVEQVRTDINPILKAKGKEKRYQVDPNKKDERGLTGNIFEARSFLFYQTPKYFDTTVGDSKKYSYADFWKSPPGSGIDNLYIPLEMKSATEGNSILVFDSTHTFVWDKPGDVRRDYLAPTLLGIVKKDLSAICILGVISPQVAAKYSTRKLVKDSKIVSDKVGFWGVNHILPIPKTLEEARKVSMELFEFKKPRKQVPYKDAKPTPPGRPNLNQRVFNTMAAAWPS